MRMDKEENGGSRGQNQWRQKIENKSAFVFCGDEMLRGDPRAVPPPPRGLWLFSCTLQLCGTEQDNCSAQSYTPHGISSLRCPDITHFERGRCGEPVNTILKYLPLPRSYLSPSVPSTHAHQPSRKWRTWSSCFWITNAKDTSWGHTGWINVDEWHQ